MSRRPGIRAGTHCLRPCVVLFAFLGLVLALGVIVPSARSTQELISARPSFGGPRNYSTVAGAWAVATGDLNADRKPDIVSVDVNSDRVSILLNRGGFAFRTAHVYRSRVRKYGSWSVAIGDLNGDQRPDLATADPDANTATILFNTGDGRFRRVGAYATGASPKDVALGDLNGDHSLDLVTANEDASRVSVFINAGAGSFENRRDYRAGRASKTNSVAIGDLNADGKLDLAGPPSNGLPAGAGT
jgi:VCBS repeat protein